MKAFKVLYQTDYESTSMIVLVEDESDIEEAVAKKNKDFQVGNKLSRSKIDSYEEVPISSLMLSDLSMEEFKKFMQVI